MSCNTKKELILCDYCQIEKDGNQIYTARKQFAGCKIIDILQTVTQRTIPPGTSVKLCSICASTLHATTGTIARAIEVISKLVPNGKKQRTTSVLETEPTAAIAVLDSESKRDTNIESPAAKERKSKKTSISLPATAASNKLTVKERTTSISSPATAPSNKLIDKERTISISSPATASANKLTFKEVNGTPTEVQSSPRKQPSKAKQPQTSTPTVPAAPSTPKKQQSLKEVADDSLRDAIKVTPAKEVPQMTKSFIQLFGATVDNATDTEEEEDDDDDVVETATKKADTKNIPVGFECKLCDFTSANPIPLKKHLKELHGQKRPRIFNCSKCTKVFGVLKTLKAHLLTHGISEEKDEKPVSESPRLAVLTALKPKPKPIESLLNSEYTFAIKDSNSSTPKPSTGERQVEPQTAPFACEICQLDLKTAKSSKEHMKTVHNIERPKVFKCDACDTHFMHKATMDRHHRQKHSGKDGKDVGPAKIKGRRKTIAIDSSTIEEPVGKKAEATTKTKSPLKITVRRKTVAAELAPAEQPPKKVRNKSPLKDAKKLPENNVELNEDVIEVPIDVKLELLASPGKSPLKADKLAKSPAIDSVTGTPKKQKKPTQVIKESFEEKLGSPISNKTQENGKEVTATPTNTKNKMAEDLNLVTPNSKNKSKNNTGTDILDSSEILKNGTPGKKDKSKKDIDTVDSSQVSAITNDTPKNSGKRKGETQLEEEPETSQADTAEESETFNLAKLKPIKKSKPAKRSQPADSDIIDLLDEINPNVKPHKRQKLDSMELSESELSCSMCNKVLGTRKRLDSHMHKKHATQLTCPICRVKYTENMEYIRHFAKCDSDGGLPCGIKKCTKVFAAANFLCNHLNKKHKNTQ